MPGPHNGIMTIMQSSDFRRVITNGLGRANLWLQQNPWQPHEDSIRHVCLHNTAYDAQCEGSRADYVFQIVNLTDDRAHFANIATLGLLEVREYWDTWHLFHLNRLFAQSGHANARDAIYEKFKRNDAAEPFIGADELIKLDGANALLFVLDNIGKWIETHPDYWVDDWLVRTAQEQIKSDCIALARKAAEKNANIRRYFEAVEKHDKDTSHQQAPDFRKFSYSELREKILASNGKVLRGWLSRWGKHASEESINAAAADLLSEQDEDVLWAYLRIFNLRAFPLGHGRLVQLAKSENGEIAKAARRALGQVQSDMVRALALDLIRTAPADSDAVRLLEKNYKPDDHTILESLLDDQSNEDDFHWIGHSAIHVFEANPQAPALASLLTIYENGRCSLCRKNAVNIMVERQIIPSAILEEYKFDSYEDRGVVPLRF